MTKMTQTKPERRVDNKEILESVNEIRDRVAEIQRLESARAEREKINDELIKDHQKAIKGNGKPGLQTEMQLVKDNLKRVNAVGAIVTGAIILDLIARVLSN